MIRRKIAFLLPAALALSLKLHVLRVRDVILLIGISLVGAVTDVFGLLMILPLLEFIQSGSNAAALAAKSRFWTELVGLYGWFGISVNLLSLSSAVVFFIILRSIALASAVLIGARLREKISSLLRMRLFNAFATASPSAIRSMSSGSFVVACSQHAQASGNIAGSLPPIATALISIAVYALTSLFIMPGPTALILVAAGVILLTLSRYVTIAKRLSFQLARLQEDYAQKIGQRFRGWRLLKFASAAEREAGVFDKLGKEISSTYFGHTHAAAMIGLIVTPLAAMLVVGTLVISVEWFQIDIARITLLTLIMVRLLPLVEALLRSRQQMATIGASFGRVDEIVLMLEDSREVRTGSQPFPALRHGIDLVDISKTYDGIARPAVSGVSVHIPAGRVTAIMGESGAGKTTLVDIISGLEQPSGGSLAFDGVMAGDIMLNDYRNHILYIPQTPIFYDGTIGQNICYLAPEATAAQISWAASQANAAEFIEALPLGYDTPLSEDGTNLSGGQRQRLALARAFLSRAPIIILDEPTSAVDQKSEAAIREAISRLRDMVGKTILLISHSSKTVADADCVIHLKNGVLDSVRGPDAAMAAG